MSAEERIPLVGGDAPGKPEGGGMRKTIWSTFMTLVLVAIAIVGGMMMFSGGKEIASRGRELIREIDNATVMDVHDYDYLRGLDDYESDAQEVQSAIDYDYTHAEHLESAALGAAPKVHQASGDKGPAVL